jgi:uncharacterized membrane protein
MFTQSKAEVAPVAGMTSFDILALALIILLCVGLRVYHIAAASLWTDEIFSRYYAELFGRHYLFTTGLSTEATPPTYSLLLQAWMAIFGGSEAAMRSFSTVASTLCVPVTYLFGRELAGNKQGLLGALLFALCPMSLYFAQEARVYALFMLATALALWAVAVFLRDLQSIKAMAGYFVFATACIYLHGTGVLYVGACAVGVGLFLLAEGVRGRLPLVKWAALNVFVLLLGVPYFLHEAQASRGGGLDWIPPTTYRTLVYCLSMLVSGILTPYPWPAFVLAALVIAALAVSLFLHRPAPRVSVVLIGIPCLFIALVFALSLKRPILLPRIVSWTVVPFCLLAACQILVAGRARLAVLLTVAVAFGAGLLVQIKTPSSNKEPWRAALQSYAPQLQQADLVVLSPLFDPMVLTYYAPQVKHARLWDASLRPTIMNGAAERLHIAPITEAEIAQQIQQGHAVWILSNAFDLPRVNALRNRLPSTDFREWPCGKSTCVVVAGWQPHR